MGRFDRFENAVEKGVNNVFSKVFRSGLKPVDISSALHRVMDDQIEIPEGATADNANPVAPNFFVVRIANSDLETLEGEGIEATAEELERGATRYAEEQNYVLAGPVSVKFEGTDEESTGTLEIIAEVRRGSVAPATGATPTPTHPIIDVDGEKWLLTEDITVIGRSSKADIQVDDSGVSRKHVEFRITPQGVILTDLGSTNGTFVEGHRVEAATLLDGNQITIGRTRILFWTHPEE